MPDTLYTFVFRRIGEDPAWARSIPFSDDELAIEEARALLTTQTIFYAEDALALTVARAGEGGGSVLLGTWNLTGGQAEWRAS